MRLSFLWLQAALVTTSLVTTGFAQVEPKPLPAPPAIPGLPSRPLLLEPIIQQEIGLTNKQRENLTLIEAQGDESRQAGLADAGDDDFDFNAMMGGLEVTAKEQRAAIAKLLTPAQKARLLQLEWQRAGWLALSRPDLATKLKLSPTQNQKIRAIIDSMRQRQSQGSQVASDAAAARKNAKTKATLNPSNGFQGNPDEMLPGGGPLNFTPDGLAAQASHSLEQARKAQESAAIEVNQLLSAETRAAYERLLGPPFDFKRLDGGLSDSGTPAPTPARVAPKSKRAARPR